MRERVGAVLSEASTVLQPTGSHVCGLPRPGLGPLRGPRPKEEDGRQRLATSLVFLANGSGIGAWAAGIAGIKAGLGLTATALGSALLMLAVGAMSAMPFAGWLAARRGRLVMPCALLFAVALLLPALARTYWMLLPSLFAVGAASGTLDVLMNAHAARVEQAYGRAIMSSFHAAWSLGGLVGAGATAALLHLGQPNVLPFAAAWVAVLAGAAWRLGLDDRAAAGRPGGFAWPSRALAGLGALCLLAFMTEGAVADWSGVFLRSVAGASPAMATAGFAGFSAAMVLGRLTGDTLVRRFGPAMVLRAGALLAVAGFAVVVALPAAAAAGFALVGLGVANMAPLLLSAAGRSGPAASTGVAAVATMGYAGLLLGPPLIGAAADQVGLRAALGLLVLTAGALAVVRLREP